MIRALFLSVLFLTGTFAFMGVGSHPRKALNTRLRETENETQDGEELKEVELFLNKRYPSFSKILLNDDVRKAINDGKSTIFVPNEAAFERLDEKKRSQITDPRNEEIREKMGSYHLLPGQTISAIELKTEDWTKGRPKDGSKPNTLIAGIVTLSGEVPVGRSKSGGFLGFGAKEDGDIVVGPKAKIVQSFNVQDSMIHEMDGFISPQVLWRYMDQLRIPGF